jgi:hypothetical protein
MCMSERTFEGREGRGGRGLGSCPCRQHGRDRRRHGAVPAPHPQRALCIIRTRMQDCQGHFRHRADDATTRRTATAAFFLRGIRGHAVGLVLQDDAPALAGRRERGRGAGSPGYQASHRRHIVVN